MSPNDDVTPVLGSRNRLSYTGLSCSNRECVQKNLKEGFWFHKGWGPVNTFDQEERSSEKGTVKNTHREREVSLWGNLP